jgi:hypothetical protein
MQLYSLFLTHFKTHEETGYDYVITLNCTDQSYKFARNTLINLSHK